MQQLMKPICRPLAPSFLKLLVLAFGFVFFASYLFVEQLWNSKYFVIKINRHSIGMNDSEPNNKAYFVNTIGCKMPSFKVLDETISKYVHKVSPITCKKSLFISEENSLVLNMNLSELYSIYKIPNLKDVTCEYKELIRKNDMKNFLDSKVIKFELSSRIEIKSKEFIQVLCKSKSTNYFYEDYFVFLNDKNKPKKSLKTEGKLSVLILGINSVSRLNFLRQMNSTYSFITSKLNSIEFQGFNKVGDNTYPNLIPLLSGLTDFELSSLCLPGDKNSFYDFCPFIWNEFKKNDYQTIFAEDVGSLSFFNFLRSGFKKKPTNYYLRPILLEMESKISTEKCLGGLRPIDVLYNYLYQFLPLFQKGNYFSFLWTASVTHDFFNSPQLIDNDTVKLMNALYTTNVLNKTILFFISDHGLKWGVYRETYQGMMEERQPFLYIMLPDWFRFKYPIAYENLKTNARRLTTPFDIYATLLDVTHAKSLQDNEIFKRSMTLIESDSMPRSISLFLPIPRTRTCENAGISLHWCTCHEEKRLPTNDPLVQKAARFVVRKINEKLNSHKQCRELYLNSISEAIVFSPNHKVYKVAKENDITVRLETKPGLGEFEATVRLKSDSIDLSGPISRTNFYGKQSYCIDDYNLKMYCYCER